MTGPWETLLDDAALAAVIPDEYARFRPAVRDALAVFLQGLPPQHQLAILAEQGRLSPKTTAAERLAALARRCPALHKLGQILARDRRLSAEFRRHLQQLESLPPSVPLEVIQDTLHRELGPLGRRGVHLLPPALAEASVAVVIPFRQERAASGEQIRDGVFKVLKPGIEERLEQELALFERVGSYLDQKCDELGLPQLDYRDTFEQVRDKLRNEVRLDLEQLHLAQARAAYADEPRVQVPALLEHCTPRITAMERVAGGKVTEQLPGKGGRCRLAELVIEALIARPLFSEADPALFHADPHAGNLFLTHDQRLGALDWSLVGALGAAERAALVQILLGALALGADDISSALAGLSARGRIDRAALAAVVDTGLRHVRRGAFPGFTWLMALCDDAIQKAGLRVTADLLLFRKSLHALEGVVADVGGQGCRIDAVLWREFACHLMGEWPVRWLAPPDCRAFATRLSNIDLIRFALSLPWVAARPCLSRLRPG